VLVAASIWCLYSADEQSFDNDDAGNAAVETAVMVTYEHYRLFMDWVQPFLGGGEWYDDKVSKESCTIVLPSLSP